MDDMHIDIAKGSRIDTKCCCWYREKK